MKKILYIIALIFVIFIYTKQASADSMRITVSPITTDFYIYIKK